MADPVEAHPIILFDGVCNLCNGFVQFLLERDREGFLRFASLQSRSGKRLQEEHGIPDSVDSIVLVTGDTYHVKSGAVLRILHYLPWAWSLSTLLLVVPRFLRDAVYDWVAGNRYDWFGKQDVCMAPTEDIKDRFLDMET